MIYLVAFLFATLFSNNVHSLVDKATKSYCAHTRAKVWRPNQDMFPNGRREQKIAEKYPYYHRLETMFSRMGEHELHNFIREFDEIRLQEIKEQAGGERLGWFENWRWSRNEGQRQFIDDVLTFYRDYPQKNLLGQDPGDTRTRVLAALKVARGKYGSRPRHGQHEGEAELSQYLSQAEKKLIDRAVGEYKGVSFGEGFLLRKWNSFWRFIFPTYKRVKRAVEQNNAYRRRMQLTELVDQVVQRNAIEQAESLGLGEEQVRALKMFLADTPGQMLGIQEEFHKAWGIALDRAGELDIDNIDIGTIYHHSRKQNSHDDEINQQRLSEDNLDAMNRILDAAFQTTHGRPRAVEDFGPAELQIRFQQRGRQRRELREQYLSTMHQSSKESYRVERRRTRRVPDGTDKDGNTKYRTEVYYVWDTVYPSYMDIVNNSYDRGDRFVSGLQGVKFRTSKFRRIQGRYINHMTQYREAMLNVMQNYLLDPSARASEIAKLESLLDDLKTIRENLAEHRAKSNQEIFAIWSNDSPNHFRVRNNQMIQRYNNMEMFLRNAIIQLKQGSESLDVPYREASYPKEMEYLRKKARKAMWIKITMALVSSASGGAGYYYREDIEELMDEWGEDIDDYFEESEFDEEGKIYYDPNDDQWDESQWEKPDSTWEPEYDGPMSDLR